VCWWSEEGGSEVSGAFWESPVGSVMISFRPFDPLRVATTCTTGSNALLEGELVAELNGDKFAEGMSVKVSPSDPPKSDMEMSSLH